MMEFLDQLWSFNLDRETVFGLFQQSLVFIIGMTAILASLGVILCASPIYSALYLIGNMVCLALLFLLFNAEFLAVVQVVVYAGAVMVLFLFASLIINIPRALQLRQWNRQSVLAVLMAGVTGLCMIVATVRAFGGLAAPEATPLGTPEAVGRLVFSDYILPFELASLVLLAAMVGAIYLARGAADEEAESGVATAHLTAVGDDHNESR